MTRKVHDTGRELRQTENSSEPNHDLHCECCMQGVRKGLENFKQPSELPASYDYQGSGEFLFCGDCLEKYDAGYLRYQLELWKKDGNNEYNERLLEALKSERGFSEENYNYWLNGELEKIND